ncbi:hypothetical protein FHW67_002305 [Herbaspirillum sp. Sphag1AN]|uniref:ArnT family glycosyltransferase n=1 Tax=unclassified Herbaspirillum TaxID=2624150 RepID=UPI0016192BCE|nr:MULTISPECIES: glycosyltransferase family 39 protein [unclassified Herbaspirillum]MBB3213017.1 hypothetical protein [Herbaspirillum sp. Sphag1AN]MBB3246214.1 hypothetical protein [Herbaspirillum sp. Sphag64]
MYRFQSNKFVIRYALLLVIIGIYLQHAWKFIHLPIPPDAEITYIPLAKKLIEQGWRFFLSSDSIQVGPAIYSWFAIFGADDYTIRYANILSGCIMVLLAYGIARRMHSIVAGILAALLFAASPLIVSWIPRSLSETPFFLFTLMWIWALGEVIAFKRWAIPVAAIALSISILLRPVWLYPVILLLVALSFSFLFSPKSRAVVGKVFWVHILALLLPGLFVVKNLLLFGTPNIAEGGGGALYYGTNLLTGGFEPPLLGMNYQGLTRSIFTVAGNHDYGIVAAEFLKHRSFSGLLEWFFRKISWVTFFTPLEASARMSWFRVVELAMAVTAVAWGFRAKRLLVILVGAGILLQVLQTALVLYNIRYSVGNVELLLVPLAAVGIALMFERTKGDQGNAYTAPGTWINRHVDRATGIVLLCAFISMFYLRVIPRIGESPDIPVRILFEKFFGKSDVSAAFVQDAGKKISRFTLDIPSLDVSRKGGNLLWQVSLMPASSVTENKACKQASISYLPNGMAPRIPVDFSFVGNGDYAFGTAYDHSILLPDTPGKLVIEVKCFLASGIAVRKIAFVESTLTEVYEPYRKPVQ